MPTFSKGEIVTTALVIKIVLPLSLLALFGVLYKTFETHPAPRQFNARQQRMIDSLKSADSGLNKELK